MKVKRQNHSIIFKGFVLVLAFALAVLCTPMDGFRALALMAEYTDYSYMTIGKTVGNEEVQTTVTQGDIYYITNAYIGGQENFAVGKVNSGTLDGEDGSVTLVASSVKVTYNAVDIDQPQEGSAETVDETGKVVVYSGDEKPGYYGHFVAENLGTYTISYSYEYQIGDETYKNRYDLRVESILADASINFEDNDTNFLPKIYDLALAKQGDSYKDLHIPTPVIKDGNGEEIVIANEKFVFEQPSDKSGSYVVVTASGGSTNESITLKKDGEGNMYISGDTFKLATKGASTYTIKYAYYENGQFVTSTTKSTTVYAEDDKYYENYKLDIEVSNWNKTDVSTGVERELPVAVGLTGKDTKPNARESVDTSYVVRVYYRQSLSDSWAPIDQSKYNEDEVVVIDENGTLKDPSKFKPLFDGYYTFEYEVTDAYNKKATTKKGVYVFEDIKDTQKPTPIVYDASTNSQEDVSYKLASRANPNGIIIYAIGMEDNVSKATDEGVELIRKINTDETITKVTIDSKYSKYNLIFNYNATAGNNDAYINLLTYNRTALKDLFATVDSDEDAIKELRDANYRIVVDNANYESIYNIFSKDGYTIFPDTVTDKDTALEFFKSEAGLTAGFAYINTDKTFGVSSTETGLGTGEFSIHYIAKDKAGNEGTFIQDMYVSSFTDDDAPTINFSTTLSGYYLPSSTITFDAPTANDNSVDLNMQVRTFYRFLDAKGSVIAIKDAENPFDKNLSNVWEDLDGRYDTNNTLLTDVYEAYHEGEGDGYCELTDNDLSSYKIDLSQGTEKAKTLQIFVFAYDDSGNVGVYAQTINVLNVDDEIAPIFSTNDMLNQSINKDYMQDDEIEIPEITVYDDQVGYVDFDVKVYYGADNEIVSTYGAYAERQILSSTGAGKYTVKGAKFTAGMAGDYQVVITVKDSSNNIIVSFVNYTVEGRTIISQPSLNEVSLTDQEIELDDYYFNDSKVIELPIPKISYQIPDSVTYDVYSKLEEEEKSKYTTVIRGVDENGAATNYSTGKGFKDYFKPTKVEDVTIQYVATVEVYDTTKFTYNELNLSSGSVSGGYYKYNDQVDTFVYVVDENVYRIEHGESLETIVTKNEDGSYIKNGDTIEDTILDGIFENLKVYKLTSSIYTIKVKDTKVYDSALRYDYETIISNNDITSAEGYDLVIKAINAQDASEIDIEKSYVELKWNLANGNNSSKRWTGLVEDTIYNIKSTDGNGRDGTYTITYYIYDKAGNSSSKSYEIAVGDNIKPTIQVEDDFIKTSYEIGSKLIINRGLVTASDASGIEEIIYSLTNTTTNEEIDLEKYLVLNNYELELDEVGTYQLTIQVKDKVGNLSEPENFDFEVTAKAKDSVMTYKVVGTILIVISVIVLVGVIVYFIVSKVKLDKELKK